ARAAGVGLAVVGILVAAGMLPTLVSSASSMADVDNMELMNDNTDGGPVSTMTGDDSSMDMSVDIPSGK
ncbi:MAG: hypothetical protein ACREBU_26700, partial [Nitrososphaera sp.]